MGINYKSCHVIISVIRRGQEMFCGYGRFRFKLLGLGEVSELRLQQANAEKLTFKG